MVYVSTIVEKVNLSFARVLSPHSLKVELHDRQICTGEIYEFAKTACTKNSAKAAMLRVMWAAAATVHLVCDSRSFFPFSPVFASFPWTLIPYRLKALGTGRSPLNSSIWGLVLFSQPPRRRMMQIVLVIRMKIVGVMITLSPEP